MAPGKQKHYAVRQGRSVGVLSTWDECKESVLGCKGAQYKSFATEREAQEWLAAGTVQPIQDLSSYMPGGASNKRPALVDDYDYEADYSSKRSAVARPGNSQLAITRPAAAQQGGGHWSVGVRAMHQSHHASRGGAAGGHAAATSVVSGAATQTARATQKPGSEVIISSVKSEGMMAATSLPACDPNKHYCMNFDGASRGNPGQAGSGVTVYERDSGVEVAALTHPLPFGCTNNEAEYCGLILGLEVRQPCSVCESVRTLACHVLQHLTAALGCHSTVAPKHKQPMLRLTVAPRREPQGWCGPVRKPTTSPMHRELCLMHLR
ncbi:RNase H domain-containing protein, partial [Haematococcus lacustris]